jgi:outer membrane receptor protein involved in Fe transport
MTTLEEDRHKKNNVPPAPPARHRPMGLVAQLASLLLLAQALHAGAAAAAFGAPMEVDMAGGPLANLLLEIGSRYRVIISFPPKLVEGLRAPSLRGRYPLEAALAHALDGSDLVADIAPSGVVTLKRVVRTAAAAADPRHEPLAADPAGPVAKSFITELQRVVVTATTDHGAGPPAAGFTALADSTGTLLDAPRSEIPQAVSVVTRDMLAVAQARTQLDALDYAAGIVSYNRGWGFESSAKARGFPAQFLLMGLPSYGGALSLDAAVIERVEMAKGPSGVVGGVASSESRGAVVNFIRKEPFAGQKPQAMLRVDSQDGGTAHLMADLGGGDGPMLWRLVGYGMHSGRTDAGYAPAHASGALASTRYQSGNLSVTLALQHEQRRSVLPRQLGVRMPDFTDAPAGLQITDEEPPISRDDGKSARVLIKSVAATWRLSQTWSLRAQAHREQTATDLVISGYDAQSSAAGVNRWVDRTDGKAWRLSLHGEVDAGPVRHQLLLAGDGQSLRFAPRYAAATWMLPPGTFVPGQTPLPPQPTNGSLDLQESRHDPTSEQGILLQDQLRIGDLTTRLAVRHARLKDGDVLELNAGEVPVRILSGQNWDVGVAYRVTPTMTVYAGAQTALEASHYAGKSYRNRVIAPARPRQQQVGAKFDLLDGGLGFSVEAYRLQQSNVMHLSLDESGGAEPCYATGLLSKGVELELAGRASAALDLSVGVNAMSAREQRFITSSQQLFWAGNPAAPQRSMHLLATYRLPDSLASGLSASVAMKAQSRSWVTVPDPGIDYLQFRIPGGAKVDMSLTRRVQHWTFGASVQNLFNRRLYEPSISVGSVGLLRARSIGFTLGYGG